VAWTRNGLVRFGGHRFEVFDEITPRIEQSVIIRLFETVKVDYDCTDTGVLAQGRPGHNWVIASERRKRLSAICQDVAGAVWLCHAKGEFVWRYHKTGLTPSFRHGTGLGA